MKSKHKVTHVCICECGKKQLGMWTHPNKNETWHHKHKHEHVRKPSGYLFSKFFFQISDLRLNECACGLRTFGRTDNSQDPTIPPVRALPVDEIPSILLKTFSLAAYKAQIFGAQYECTCVIF